MLDLVHAFSNLGPLVGWAAVCFLLGGQWVTVTLGIRELKRGQRESARRVRLVSRRVRRVEHHLKLEPDGGGRR